MTKQMVGDGRTTLHGYSADGERVGTWDSVAGGITYVLRGLDNKPLRQYREFNGGWTWQKDWIYRDGLALATVEPTGTKYFHLDHLGTPRRITNGSRAVIASHDYYPFGEEITASSQDAEALKFTGHERDLRDPTKTTDDLDYMHARHYNPWLGRFLSTDPIGGAPGAPQSWNRYSYVQNNSINATDPTGQFPTWATMLANLVTGDGARGAATHSGATMVNDGVQRIRYNETVSSLAPDDSAGRTAAKVATREAMSPLGQNLSEAMHPIGNEASKTGGRANVANPGVTAAGKTSVRAGGALIMVSLGASAVSIANAPEGERGKVASQEVGAQVGGASFGAAGAWAGGAGGTAVCGPICGVIGAVVFGVGGGAAGGELGGQAGKNVYDMVVED